MAKRVTEVEAIERVTERCNEKGYKFLGFVNGWTTTNKTKLILECPKHGIWETSNYNTFVNKGIKCPDCGFTSISKTKQTPKDVFEEAVLSRCKELGYKFLGIVGGVQKTVSSTKLILECPEHGVWDTTNYLSFTSKQKCGCPVCAGNIALTEEIALDRILSKCVEKGYKFLGFVKGWLGSTRTKLILECSKGTIWDTTNFDNFINGGNGCVCCSLVGGGYDQSKAGVLYLYRWFSDNTSLIKFGITNHADHSKRVKQQSKHTELVSYELASYCFEDGSIPYAIEKEIKARLNTGVISKELFGDGYTETVTNTKHNFDVILSIINKYTEGV